MTAPSYLEVGASGKPGAVQNDFGDQLINVRFLPSIAAPDNVDG
jgi:hypothetical protein